MKTLEQFKHVFFPFLITLVLMVSFNSCNKDDDDFSDDQTFLELYAGTTWVLNNDGGVPADAEVPTYFRFINNTNEVLEGWYQVTIDPECYYYAEGINIDNGAMTLMENSENIIIIKINYTNESGDLYMYGSSRHGQDCNGL